jgi:L-seryl-tRNA(Ser) seleniumtransferase
MRARALRPGSHVLAGLQQIALTYLRRDGASIPFWAMATATTESLQARAAALGCGEVVPCSSVAGGGALPGVEIPSFGISLAGDHTAALRASRPVPVVARVEADRTILDLRTVAPDDDGRLAAVVRAVLDRP